MYHEEEDKEEEKMNLMNEWIFLCMRGKLAKDKKKRGRKNAS